MKITNKYGLPEAICDAVMNDGYDGGVADISVTSLLKPPQIVELTRRHWDELEEDCSDRLWALMGQAMHAVLERAQDSAIQEQRLYTDIAGWRVSGQFDRLHVADGVLQDYKFASVWEAIFGLKAEREQQLNLLNLLANHNGYEIRQLQAVLLFRDWSATKALQGGDYPQQQIQIIDVPLWPLGKASEFALERVRLHQQARDEGLIPPCSDADRWARPDVWAVMKKGRKSAVKLYDNEAAASAHALQAGGYVEFRRGQQTRCERYCPVRDVCLQFQQLRINP